MRKETLFFQAGDIPFEKIITYQVEVFLSVTLQIFAHDVDFELKVTLFFTVGWVRKSSSSISLSSGSFAFGMQVELQYSTRRMIFFHVLPESDFSVLLLVRTTIPSCILRKMTISLFLSGEQHQHPCSKISALT